MTETLKPSAARLAVLLLVLLTGCATSGLDASGWLLVENRLTGDLPEARGDRAVVTIADGYRPATAAPADVVFVFDRWANLAWLIAGPWDGEVVDLDNDTVPSDPLRNLPYEPLIVGIYGLPAGWQPGDAFLVYGETQAAAMPAPKSRVDRPVVLQVDFNNPTMRAAP